MGDVLERRAIMVSQRAIPVIAVIGPSGVGKSLLARKIAQLTTRSQAAPNVLLVDGDPYSRGLTIKIEEMTKLTCGSLHDVIVVGRNPQIEPVDLTEIQLKPSVWHSLPEEGHLFFLPSAQKDAVNPFIAVSKAGLSDIRGLQRLLGEAISFAGNGCDAGCIVIDTASIAEPCGAALASFSSVTILVGSPDKNRTITDQHQERLREFGAPLEKVDLEIIYNQLDGDIDRSSVETSPLKYHSIPRLNGLSLVELNMDAETLANSISLDSHIAGILDHIFRVRYPQLVPRWYAPLPAEWRKLADTVEGGWRKLCGVYWRSGLGAVSLAFVSLICLLLAFGAWPRHATSELATPVRSLVGLGLSGVFLLCAWLCAAGLMTAFRVCTTLAQEDVDGIVRLLQLSRKRMARTPPERRRKILERRLKLLRKTFGNLQSRTVPE